MEENEDVRGGDDRDSEFYTRRCRWIAERNQQPSEIVVATVAKATGRDPNDLRPLFEVIDPEALDKLFERRVERPERSVNGTVTFEFEGCEVRVEAEGRTVVVPRESGDE